MNNILIGAHCADLHFGAFDPSLQYQILSEQFISVLEMMDTLDFVTINGDIFDHKFMSNSDPIMYAIRFIDDLIRRVIFPKQATLIILGGTYSHDCGQLKLFYHYMNNKEIDVRVIESLSFQIIKGMRVLCIPELSSVSENVYNEYLLYNGMYDLTLMHGTIKGSVMGDNVGSNARLFTIDDFCNCKGPIISGHIHTGGCFNGRFYYCGTPYTYRFGENDDKGFLISIHEQHTGDYFIRKELINSFIYKTIQIDEFLNKDPKQIIDYINNHKRVNGIDKLRIKISSSIDPAKRMFLSNHYRNNKDIVLQFENTIMQQNIENNIQQTELYNENEYLFSNSLSPYEKFVRYVNSQENENFISVDEFKKIMESGL